MSTNLSRLVQPFVTSVIVGKDVVPRVSVVNLGRLIDQMVRPNHCHCSEGNIIADLQPLLRALSFHANSALLRDSTDSVCPYRSSAGPRV